MQKLSAGKIIQVSGIIMENVYRGKQNIYINRSMMQQTEAQHELLATCGFEHRVSSLPFKMEIHL